MIIQVPNPVVEIHDLTVSYNHRPVLWGIDFTLPEGALVGAIGPNGAGKSTLIKAVMDLIPLSSGYIRLYDKELSKVRHRVSYVPQRESVDWDFPASVFDVVMMGRYHKIGLFKRPSATDRKVVAECIAKVGMENFSNRQISQLSGGQQQRVFLARSLAQEADLYFMDEPFAGVDASTEVVIIELLRNMTREGKTIVVVHHDLASAAEYFDWILLLNLRLVASGPTDDVLTTELLQKTYGGKLTVLSKVGDLLERNQFAARERKK